MTQQYTINHGTWNMQRINYKLTWRYLQHGRTCQKSNQTETVDKHKEEEIELKSPIH